MMIPVELLDPLAELSLATEEVGLPLGLLLGSLEHTDRPSRHSTPGLRQYGGNTMQPPDVVRSGFPDKSKPPDKWEKLSSS